jgi:hypothetical protein
LAVPALYLQPSDLLAINRALTGDPEIGVNAKGVDLNALIRATERPQEPKDLNAFPDYELFPTMYDKAGVLLDELLSRPPFQDQNAATAVIAVFVFLRQNGVEMDIDEAALLGYIEEGQLPRGYPASALFLGSHDARPRHWEKRHGIDPGARPT